MNGGNVKNDLIVENNNNQFVIMSGDLPDRLLDICCWQTNKPFTLCFFMCALHITICVSFFFSFL